MSATKCPNKASEAWRQLAAGLGSETLAYAAWLRNSEDIPTLEVARSLIQESNPDTLEQRLEGFLEKLNVGFRELDDLKRVTGFSALGATDLLYKSVMVQRGAPVEVLAKETAYVAYSFLGKKNKIRTDLISNVAQLPDFAERAAPYQGLSDYKVRELVTVDFLAEAIANNWQTPTQPDAEGRVAEYWQIAGNSRLEKRLNYLLARIRRWWNELTGRGKLTPEAVEALAHDMARDILNHNFRKFGTDLKPDQQLMHYEETIAADPKAAEIVGAFQEMGLLLTGSLALRKEGTIYREPGETLHDLDFTVTDDVTQREFSALGEGFVIPTMGGLGRLSVPASEAQRYMQSNPEEVLSNLPLVQRIRAAYPSFRITNVFRGLSEGEYSMAGDIDGYAIDLFFMKVTDVDRHAKGFQDWEPIFKAKILMGRAKDMRDFANYVPFNPDHGMRAQEKGFRHFTFAPITEQQTPEAEAAVPDQLSFYAPLADYADKLSRTVLRDERGPLVVYHGSSDPIGTFKFPGEEGYSRNTADTEAGVYFSLSKAEAQDYGPYVNPSHILLENPYWWYAEDRLPGFNNPLSVTQQQVEQLVSLGYDGIITKRPGDLSASGENDYVVAFFPEQILPADDRPLWGELPFQFPDPDEEAHLDQLSFYRDQKHGYTTDVDVNTPLDRIQSQLPDMHTVGRHLFGDEFAAFMAGTSTRFPPDEMVQPGVWSDTKGDYLTNMEYFMEAVDKYYANRLELRELHRRMEEENWLETASDTELELTYKRLRFEMGQLEREKFGGVYWRLGNAIGDRKTMAQLRKLGMADATQEDIGWVAVYTRSIADMDATQAGIQQISEKISTAATKTKVEYYKAEHALGDLMKEVLDLHYAIKPKSWREKTWGRVLQGAKIANEPFTWLFESDPSGNPTQFVAYTDVARARDEAIRKYGKDSNEAQLALARFNLYQFILQQNMLLGAANGRPVSRFDRAFMPKTSMDVFEEYDRNGLYAAFVSLFGGEYRDALGGVKVEYNGVTKTVKEWKDELKGANLSLVKDAVQTVKNTARLNRIYKKAEALVRAGQGGISGELARAEVGGFNASPEIPFRYVADKEEFSINVHKMLTGYMRHMIFKKHHDPLVPEMESLRAYYAYYSQKGGEAFDQNIKFLDMYAERYLYNEKGLWDRSWWGKAMNRMATWTVLSYLGVSPATSGYNLGVGLVQAWQDKMARDGWAKGNKKMMTGFSRLMGAHGGKRALSNGDLWAEKARAILEYYRVETFTKTDIEQYNDQTQVIQNGLMWAQARTESMIRGVSLLGEMSQEQWDNFYMQDGQLYVMDDALEPRITEVNQWLYDIGKIQGDYSVENRRNYHSVGPLRLFMLFKGWLPDYLQARFRPKWTDRYGRTREGQFVTMVQLMGDYRRTLQALQGKGTLEEHELVNLRRIAFDAAVWLLLAVASYGAGDDEDEGWNKLSAQLFLYLHPRQMLKMAANPFPSLMLLDQVLAGLEHMFTDPAKGAKTLGKAIPGNRLVGFTADALEPEDQE